MSPMLPNRVAETVSPPSLTAVVPEERHRLDFPGSQAAISLTRVIDRSGRSLGDDWEELVDLVELADTTDTGERVAILINESGRMFAKRIGQVRAIGPVARAMMKVLP
jgi:hypothetical protein